MIRYCVLLLALAAVVCGAGATTPAAVCDITSYGASTTASGATNSAAVQAAFAACNNGGTVRVPAGTFPIERLGGCTGAVRHAAVLWGARHALDNRPCAAWLRFVPVRLSL